MRWIEVPIEVAKTSEMKIAEENPDYSIDYEDTIATINVETITHYHPNDNNTTTSVFFIGDNSLIINVTYPEFQEMIRKTQ